MRDATTNGVYKTLKNATYPRRVGTDWEILIDTAITTVDGATEINVQDKNLAYVDITPPVCAGTVHPVYPGTNQIIEQARDIEILPGDDERYWFYIWTLVDPIFYSENVDLENGEIYKLLPTIEFKCFEEIESKAILSKTVKDDECTSCIDRRYQYTTRIINREFPTVIFDYDGELDELDALDTGAARPKWDSKNIWEMNVSYKTETDRLPPNVQNALQMVSNAIIHRVAAELPLKDCGCKETIGFIAEQQKSYVRSSVHPYSGEVTRNYFFGQLHGQLEYRHIMANVPSLKITRI